WAYGAGRAASIVGPIYGATALDHHLGALGYFFLLAVPLALAAIVIWTLLTVKPLGKVMRAAGH
ncbi:MAG TPA: hypothetical protein VNQ31_00105, partial [Sphingomonadaceae bacterium]|nr:hypothetical protein [Sphingomonadaceae bacterium]